MQRSLSRSRVLSGLVLLVTAAAMSMVSAVPAGATASPGCAPGGVKVQAGASPATVTVNDTTASTGVPVVVTITGASFTIVPTGAGVTLDSASWCLKASTKTQTGSGASGANTTIRNSKGVLQAIGYLVVYTVTTPVDHSGECWESDVTVPLQPDSGFDGPINTLDNLSGWSSSDGTCSGFVFGHATVVQASSLSNAQQACSNLGEGTAAVKLRDFGYSAAPADYWRCA